jgi:FAD:protein FMN transferase
VSEETDIPPQSAPSPHGFACSAMGTRFEVQIACEDPTYAKQLATEAFELVGRVERELTRFHPAGDVAQLNRLRKDEALRVGPDTYECLRLAMDACRLTDGAFDATIGPLRDLWARAAGSGEDPSEEEISDTMRSCGMGRIHLSEDDNVVTPLADGMGIDLGGIGKGYAVDCVAELLTTWDIRSALIHAGESTIRALGRPPGSGGWRVALRDPAHPGDAIRTLVLDDRALSGSGCAIHGRHIMDPRTGRPAETRPAAWVAAPTATIADALSSACMVLSVEEVQRLCERCPDISAVLLEPGPEGNREVCCGRAL